MPAGRPTKYKKQFCDDMLEFYSTDSYEDIDIEHFGKEGEIKWIDKKRMPHKFPTLVEFAKDINISIRTVYDWIDENHASYQEEFSHTYTQAKRLQKNFLIQNGLQGLYNPAFAKFVAINTTDMVDSKEYNIGDRTVRLIKKRFDGENIE